MTIKWKQWFLFFVLLVLDQVTKLLAHLQGIVVLNPGVSFGLLFHVPYQFLTLGLALVLVIGAYLWFRFLPQEKMAAIWFFAGGFSNVVDRFLVKAVRDWLPVPILANKNNLADWFIVIGVALLVYSLFKQGKHKTINAT